MTEQQQAVLNFARPETWDLFQRTPEHRARFEKCVELLKAEDENPQPDRSYNVRASLVLYGDFLRSIKATVEWRASDIHDADIVDTQEETTATDTDFTDLAHEQIAQEIATLHQALPISIVEGIIT